MWGCLAAHWGKHELTCRSRRGVCNRIQGTTAAISALLQQRTPVQPSGDRSQLRTCFSFHLRRCLMIKARHKPYRQVGVLAFANQSTRGGFRVLHCYQSRPKSDEDISNLNESVCTTVVAVKLITFSLTVQHRRSWHLKSKCFRPNHRLSCSLFIFHFHSMAWVSQMKGCSQSSRAHDNSLLGRCKHNKIKQRVVWFLLISCCWGSKVVACHVLEVVPQRIPFHPLTTLILWNWAQVQR